MVFCSALLPRDDDESVENILATYSEPDEAREVDGDSENPKRKFRFCSNRSPGSDVP